MPRVVFGGCLLAALVIVLAAAGGALPAAGEPLPAEAAAGYAVWQTNGCEGCHGLYGQGGTYAPDLTHSVTQRGESYLRDFMLDPRAYHPDARQMPRFTLTQQEIDELLAFLTHAGAPGAAAVAWFPDPVRVSGTGGLTLPAMAGEAPDDADAEDAQVALGRAIFSQRCASCHALEPNVTGMAGPSLWNIANTAWRRVPGLSPQQYLRESILYPGDYLVEGYTDVMQKNFGDLLSSEDLDALVAFLMTMDQGEPGA